jgi:DNA-directed RNA polymerase specialized sigma24 family protein
LAVSAHPSTVTHWLAQLQAGDRGAAQKIWQRYYARLVGLARARLRTLPRRAADEEDVALSAFDSFCRGVEQGRFPDLHDRNNLWAVLATLTHHSAESLRQHEHRQKRGGGKVRGDSALAAPAESDGAEGFARFAGREPTPDDVAAVTDLTEHLLGLLSNPLHRRVAVMNLEGYSDAEIAAAVGYAECTVERWLRLIRSRWEKELKR